jgi:shikimate kinase / 3-dehydroquinate synthase
MAGVGAGLSRTIVLIGFMGAGKSSVADELAQALGGSARDSDTLLEERLGHTIGREFELHGEDGFRAAEEQLVCELLDTAAPGDVLALGGGSVLSERVRRALERHLVVAVDVQAPQAWERVHAQRNGDAPERQERPLVADRDAFLRLFAERAPLYERLAHAHLMGLAPGGAARALDDLRRLARAPAGTRLIWAASASGAYPVFVADGLLSEGSERALTELWPLPLGESRAFCVSDETVAALHGARLAFAGATITVAAGEESKTLAGAQLVWGELLSAGATRADHLVALGGGVVGDLAGFCAATYQRGVPVVQVPTTLLAQVDSAYGGKTGVDLPQAKNYVGVYHQPAGVFVDPGVLATLPAAEYAAGWVEVLKTALIAGGELWERVAAREAPDERMILACARTKIAIVAADERDAGVRRHLNLGHTVGHAIETATNYARFRHGEAVGLGLLAALRLSGAAELRDQVRALLADRGLPVTLAGVSAEAVLQALGRDKKRLREQVPFVLVRAPGEVSVEDDLALADVRAAVQELAA